MKLSRREFIQKTSLATGAALLAPHLRAADQKLGVALVGLGNYSTRQLAPALQLCTHCRLAGIVTGTPAKAEKWRQEYGIPAANCYDYQTFDRIADNPDIDIVYVVLPNAMHAEFSIRAAKAGKHVVCEKPMAMNVPECEAMIAACAAANVKLSVGYRLYLDPYHLEMRRLGTEKTYGNIKMIESSLGFQMADPKSWRLDKGLGGGGAIMDLGVYCIQGARRTLGELPTAVTAQGYVRDSAIFKGIYEMVMFQLEFPGGAVANATTTYTSYVDRLYATSGHRWFGLAPAYNATGASGASSEGNLVFKVPAYQQTAQLDDFADCIRHNRPSAASGQEGLIDLKIIEAIKTAADTGQKVRLAW
jgi:predicted dehydrogenase